MPLEERVKEAQFNYEDSISGHGSFASFKRIYAEGLRRCICAQQMSPAPQVEKT